MSEKKEKIKNLLNCIKEREKAGYKIGDDYKICILEKACKIIKNKDKDIINTKNLGKLFDKLNFSFGINEKENKKFVQNCIERAIIHFKTEELNNKLNKNKENIEKRKVIDKLNAKKKSLSIEKNRLLSEKEKLEKNKNNLIEDIEEIENMIKEKDFETNTYTVDEAGAIVDKTEQKIEKEIINKKMKMVNKKNTKKIIKIKITDKEIIVTEDNITTHEDKTDDTDISNTINNLLVEKKILIEEEIKQKEKETKQKEEEIKQKEKEIIEIKEAKTKTKQKRFSLNLLDALKDMDKLEKEEKRKSWSFFSLN